jgi:hypothetical protein
MNQSELFLIEHLNDNQWTQLSVPFNSKEKAIERLGYYRGNNPNISAQKFRLVCKRTIIEVIDI